MRRSLVLVPMAAVGLSLALPVARADTSTSRDTAAGHAAAGAPHKAPRHHRGNKHRSATPTTGATSAQPSGGASRSGPHPTIATALRGWGEWDVAEGSLPSPLASAVCPPEMANVDDRFCIDRWEASLVEMLPDGREVPWPPFGAVEEGHSLRAVSVPNVYPQAYISGAQAAQACAASGKRLCAPVEWRKACMGPEERKFGYGDARQGGRCNDSGTSPMLRLFPQVARSWKLVGMEEMNDPRLNQLEGTLAPTGSHDGCTNGYGVYDMVGNLHEWTNDPNGTFQGGYYLDTHRNGDGCRYRTVAHEFTYHDYSTGFRCCAEPVVP